MVRGLVLASSLWALVAAEVYFDETFGEGWKDRWVVSDWKKDEGTNGKWGWSHGDFYGDNQEDKGLTTKQDARHYGISAKFDKVKRFPCIAIAYVEIYLEIRQ